MLPSRNQMRYVVEGITQYLSSYTLQQQFSQLKRHTALYSMWFYTAKDCFINHNTISPPNVLLDNVSSNYNWLYVYTG